MCFDYIKLNIILSKTNHFILLIINILNKLKKSKIFIKLNIRKIYNFMKIKTKMNEGLHLKLNRKTLNIKYYYSN